MTSRYVRFGEAAWAREDSFRWLASNERTVTDLAARRLPPLAYARVQQVADDDRKVLFVRVSPEMHAAISALAEAERRSLNAQVEVLLEAAMKAGKA